MMVLDPVEVFGSTPVGADNFKVELDIGTEMGSLSGSFEGSRDGIPMVHSLETHCRCKKGQCRA